MTPNSLSALFRKNVLVLVIVELVHKFGAVELFQLVHIFVGVHAVVAYLNEVHRDIRAVIGYALEVRQQILQDEAQLYRALSVAQTLDMAGLKVAAELVDHVLKRLNVLCEIHVIVYKRVYRHVQYFAHRVDDDRKFPESLL